MKSIDDVGNGLLFIVGCGRSGTTLLKSILNNHSTVFIPSETLFFTSTIKNNENENIPLEKKIDILLKKWWILDVGVSRQKLEKLLEGRIGTWNEIFLALLGSLTDDENIKIFGEKTPAHINHTVQLLNDFSTSKIIHIIRDPRAVLSSYSSIPVGTNQATGVITEWLNAMTVHSEVKNNSRYYFLKYEDLIASPKMEVIRICDYLEIKYTPLMLDFYKRKNPGYSVEQFHHKNTLLPVFISSIDAWKNKLSNDEIGIIEFYLKNHMIEHGYELTDVEVKHITIRCMYAKLLDILAKNIIRRPMQLKKKYTALKRIKNQNINRT